MFEGLFFDVFGVVLLSEVGKFMAHPSKCLSVGAPHFLASFLYLLTSSYQAPNRKYRFGIELTNIMKKYVFLVTNYKYSICVGSMQL